MTTLGQLIEQTSSLLHGVAGIHEQITWLTATMDMTQITANVADSSSVKIGVAEIDEELVYVHSTGSGVLNLAPFGRGYLASDAQTHAINARVTADPMFPRHEIKQAIVECVEQVYPTIYQIKSTEFTFQAPQVTYSLPADVDTILAVEWSLTGPSNMWYPIFGWDLVEDSAEATGKAINLLEGAEQGRTVRVIYTTSFGAFVDNDSTLASIGFPESARDVLKLCAIHKLVRFMDISRMQGRTVENLSRAALTDVGDANKVANNYYALYQQRLLEEQKKLQDLHPPRPHYTR